MISEAATAAGEGGTRAHERSVVRRALLSFRRLLPEGQTLPDSVWHNRHVGVLVVLWVHAVAVPVFALVRGFDPRHAALESLILPTTALLGGWSRLPRRHRTAVASLGLLSSSAILVHLSGGVIEMHFHFFVMVALVTLYQDWVPFLAAVGYVFVHHGLMGAIDADSVYNHAAARENPWKWAAIHAVFIMGISAVCLITWRLNELALSERRDAEARLREETRIVETLHQIGQALTAQLDTHRVVQTVTDAATELTRAAYGAFFYNVLDENGEAYLLYSLAGAPIEAFSKFGLPRNTKIFAPTFGGEGVVRLDDVTKDERYGQNPPHKGMPEGHLPVRSYLAVPVRSRTGDVLGGLFFGHPEPGRFTDADERIVVGIATQAAIAIDNARLYESERSARSASEASRQRLAILADASKALTSSLDVEVAVGAFAQRVVPAVADTCVVDLVEEDGSSRRLGVPGAPGDAASGGHIVVPLVGRHDVLGTLTLARAGAKFTEADVAFAEELARRAATAVENAGLYARQRTVAETLQHSLLPDRLPEIPGILTAARYVAGGPDVEIGGDWYDMALLPNGLIGLVIGDVVGRGERAAALMGQLRSALRAYCRDRRSPAEIATRLNDLLLDVGQDHMATLVYLVLDPETGALEYVNAGHPPPLVVAPDGTASFLDGGRSVPIGAMSGAGYTPGVAMLPPGGTLVLYTDGVVEERSAPIDAGLDRLREAVSGGPDDIDALVTHVMERTVGGRASHDDAALLAVRLLPLGNHLSLRLRSHPSVLEPLRATLRRWLAGVGANEQESYELLVATSEVCANAIRHACGPVRDEFEIDATLNGGVSIRVRDHGTWRKARGDIGGRGLGIVEAYVDRLEIEPGPEGTEVRLHRALAASPAGTAS